MFYAVLCAYCLFIQLLGVICSISLLFILVYYLITPNLRQKHKVEINGYIQKTETNEELKYIRMELESQQHLQRKQRLLVWGFIA